MERALEQPGKLAPRAVRAAPVIGRPELAEDLSLAGDRGVQSRRDTEEMTDRLLARGDLHREWQGPQATIEP